ncbi:MAG: hypothetical protein J6Z35_05470 [Lachnospiraceae bacterium]|nr:hypothetical protein [Lachnospiraceae bacterium]
MLGKLLKYEWKNSKNVGMLLIGIVLGVSVLGMFYLFSPLWTELFRNGVFGDFFFLGAFFGFGGLMVYAIILSTVVSAFMIYLAVKYYRSMFRAEGYLTHTLPVKPVEILAAKVLNAGIWMLIFYFVLVSSLAVLAVTAVCTASGIGLGELLENAQPVLRDAILELEEEFGTGILELVLTYLLYFLVGAFTGPMILFGALSLGHYSKKNKGMLGILAYFGILFFMMILNNAIVTAYYSVTGIRNGFQNNSYLLTPYRIYFVTSLIVAVILFFWTKHIITKRLNLE